MTKRDGENPEDFDKAADTVTMTTSETDKLCTQNSQLAYPYEERQQTKQNKNKHVLYPRRERYTNTVYVCACVKSLHLKT